MRCSGMLRARGGRRLRLRGLDRRSLTRRLRSPVRAAGRRPVGDGPRTCIGGGWSRSAAFGAQLLDELLQILRGLARLAEDDVGLREIDLRCGGLAVGDRLRQLEVLLLEPRVLEVLMGLAGQSLLLAS